MGMFDYVKYDAECSGCGKAITMFQSKDADCRLDVLAPEDVERFYDYCSCGVWNEFRVVKTMTRIERVK